MSILYRPNVGVCLLNKDGLVFVGERIDSPGAWQMPQGGIDQDIDIKTAALRELKEEIGTDKAEILRIHATPIRYDIPEDVLLRIPRWDNRYKGQEQTWVAMRFTGADSDIVLDADEHPEFKQWRWVKLKETIDLIVPFKRHVYQQVIDAFIDLAAH